MFELYNLSIIGTPLGTMSAVMEVCIVVDHTIRTRAFKRPVTGPHCPPHMGVRSLPHVREAVGPGNRAYKRPSTNGITRIVVNGRLSNGICYCFQNESVYKNY